MFTYRQIDYNKDIPEIIHLIQTGLDESFTEEDFNWKHIQNPFGQSYGLLALDGNRIVGLRMFMFWKFYNPESKKITTAIRPVDTVVDKIYRGQGLFKNLTLKGLENCKGQYDLIFNTPNSNSLPGYLKMGWKKSEIVSSFRVGVINVFQRKPDLVKIKADQSSLSNFSNKFLETHKTYDYLQWRYMDRKYITWIFENGLIVYSINKIKGIRSLIIYELLGEEKIYNDLLLTVAKENKAYLIYYYDSEVFKGVKLLASLKRKEAVIVFKETNGISLKDFNFSLGDLEGKL